MLFAPAPHAVFWAALHTLLFSASGGGYLDAARAKRFQCTVNNVYSAKLSSVWRYSKSISSSRANRRCIQKSD
jgi:hypothetical protein